MDKQLDPNKAFPAEVLALEEKGVPLPTWYAGPLYTGNGTAEAVQELIEERDRASQGEPTGGLADDDEPPAF